MGQICIGGQRNTILVMLSDKAVHLLPKVGKTAYTFLTNIAKRAKLTRIDLAHDIYW